MSKIRYLGIIFNKNLNWNLQIYNLVGNLRLITYKFTKLKNLIPKHTMHIIYYALYQPIYQYGLLVLKKGE